MSSENSFHGNPAAVSVRRVGKSGGCKALRPLALAALTAMLLHSLSGCASLPAGSVRDPRDHLERFNRAMFRFDMTLDHAVLRPVARGYVKVAPAPVRTGISNFLSNLGYTSTIANDILQARFRDFARDLARLVVNTSLGIGGLFDPAATLGLFRHERDFGQTLGKWGVPTGSYLVLPLLGPSDVRDAFGTLPDRFMTVDGNLNNTTLNVSLFSVRAVDGRAKALPYDSTIDSAYDRYAFVRSAWFQMRDYKVHQGEKSYVPPLPPLDASPNR
jgi:phospholipid-binding lipoprotein MlaA